MEAGSLRARPSGVPRAEHGGLLCPSCCREHLVLSFPLPLCWRLLRGLQRGTVVAVTTVSVPGSRLAAASFSASHWEEQEFFLPVLLTASYFLSPSPSVDCSGIGTATIPIDVISNTPQRGGSWNKCPGNSPLDENCSKFLACSSGQQILWQIGICVCLIHQSKIKFIRPCI